MINQKKNTFLVFALVSSYFLLSAVPPLTKIYLIGDSTVCDQDLKRYPVTGWGTPFADYFSSQVLIRNHAKGGRSTRTFLEENRWKPITDSLKSGDYVLMQFGHNDEAKEPQYAARYTPVSDYKKNLIKFIQETRSKKACPILITPVSRRVFKDGEAQLTHVEYSAAVLQIGAEYNVPVIDLDSSSRMLYNRLGEQKSKWLFMELDSAEHPIYPKGRHDNTHFNDYGARIIAELVLNEIKSQKLPLADKIMNSRSSNANQK